MNNPQPVKRRLLLELNVSDEGEITLAGTGFPVRVKTPLGTPKKMSLVDYARAGGSEHSIFADRLEKLHQNAPPRANAYSCPRKWEDCDIDESLDGTIHRHIVQFYELDILSVREALSHSGLIES